MPVAGIIAEYNPLHRGHLHLLEETRRLLGPETAVVCVMSGNFVQRGDFALTDKLARAAAAVQSGADLVLELPLPWALSPAEGFARGAVELLAAAGVAAHLSFGSECGSADKLRQVADCLDSEVYQAGLRRFLDEGMPFAACRQGVVRGLLGEEAAGLLSHPNNNLGVEYLRALNALRSPIQPFAVLRAGAAHDGGNHPDYPSASFVRGQILSGTLPADNPASLSYCERAVLARLRVMTAEDWAALPDSGGWEGLPQRLVRAAAEAVSLEEFYALAKTKRYAHARIRRLALWAFLGLREADRPAHPPYLRVLGASERGRGLLREMKSRAALPVITKPAHGRGLPLLELEARCTDLYQLCRKTPGPCGLEWSTNPVML